MPVTAPVVSRPASPSSSVVDPVAAERARLLVLGIVFFTVALDFVVMLPLGPQLQRVFNVNTHQFNLAVSAYAYAAAVSGLLSALVLDRFDRKRALLFLYAGFAVGTLACALAPSYPWLVLARALAGVFGGVVGGVVLAILGDTVPEARRGAAVGAVTVAFPVAQVAGVPLGIWLAQRLSWHVPFSGIAGLSALVWVAAAALLPSVRGHLATVAAEGESPAQRLWAILANANHLRAFGLMAGITVGGFLIVPDLAAYMVRNVGVDEAHLPWLYATGGACTLFTMPLAGRLADRFGKRRVFTVMMLATIGATLWLTHVSPGAGVVVALAATAMFMICTSGRYVPAMAMITASVLPRHRGGFMSANSAVGQLFSALAATVAGVFITDAPDGRLHGYATAGGAAVLVTVAALLLGRTLRKVDDGPVATSGAVGH